MLPFTLVAALALLQAPAAPSATPDAFIDDLGKLTQAQDNDQRFDAITGMLRARGIAFTVEPFTLDKPVPVEPRTQGRNIVVTLGAGPDDLVVGAHYDAVRLPDGSLSRGAVDNGGSSIMLVRLAETLRTERLPVRLRLVWFDFEEYGLLGSQRYLAAHSGDRIRAMINFDINAYGDTILFGPPAGGDNAALRSVFLQACAVEAIDCLRFGQMPRGDDRSFGQAKIPTLSVGQLPALEAHQLWLLLHAGQNSGLAQGTQPTVLRTIHTAEDLLAKADGTSMARAHRLAAALVRQLSLWRP